MRAPRSSARCAASGVPGSRDAADRLLHHGMFKLQRNPIAEAQIAGTHKQQIVARHGGDLVDRVHRFLVFDLQSEEHLSVRMLEVLLRIGVNL